MRRLPFLLSAVEGGCCMEELLAYAILLYEGIVTEAEYQEPFGIFSYADNPLYWNDEAQYRSFYEIALAYYD